MPASVPRFTKTHARLCANKYHVNLDVVPLDEFHAGLNIEREHAGVVSKLTDVARGHADICVRIVLAHLNEDPRYYKYLQQMEIRREKYWKGRTKPSIFTHLA